MIQAIPLIALLIAMFILGYAIKWLMQDEEIESVKEQMSHVNQRQRLIDMSLQDVSEVSHRHDASLREMKTTLSQVEKSQEKLEVKIQEVDDNWTQLYQGHQESIRQIEKQLAKMIEVSENHSSTVNRLNENFLTVNEAFDQVISKIEEDKHSQNGQVEQEPINTAVHFEQRLRLLQEHVERMERETEEQDQKIANLLQGIDHEEEKAEEIEERPSLVEFENQENQDESAVPFVESLSIRNIKVGSDRDDLKVIKGVGPFIEKKLNKLGIYTFEQIANLTKEDIEKVTEAIQFFPGRIKRDRWIPQAKKLRAMVY